jgi:hypothetical protein
MTYTEPIEDIYILDKDNELLGKCSFYFDIIVILVTYLYTLFQNLCRARWIRDSCLGCS